MGKMLVFTNAVGGRDEEFNTWYDEVHLVEVLALPEFIGASRLRLADAQLVDDQPFRYLAIYQYAGSAADAINALMAAAATFRMSDAMASETRVVLCDEAPWG